MVLNSARGASTSTVAVAPTAASVLAAAGLSRAASSRSMGSTAGFDRTFDEAFDGRPSWPEGPTRGGVLPSSEGIDESRPTATSQGSSEETTHLERSMERSMECSYLGATISSHNYIGP